MSEEEKVINKYQVVSIDKIDTPNGMPGNDWYSYLIGYGKSKVEGKKPGTLKDVTRHAEAVANDLNLRSQGKKPVYPPRQQQNKKSPSTSKA